jgi:hypothetical protein
MKKNVPYVGYLQRLYRDSWPTEHKICSKYLQVQLFSDTVKHPLFFAEYHPFIVIIDFMG